MIRHKESQKCYIGQSHGTFRRRYDGGRWWGKTSCKKLKSDAVLYGHQTFEVVILEHSKTKNELNKLESIYADKYNAYQPNGYNKIKCGVAYSFDQPSLLSDIGPIELNDPLGNNIKINDPVKFCEDHGLCKHRIWRVVVGKSRIHYGWTNKDDVKKGHHKAKSYTIYDREGNKYNVLNMAEFCRQKKISSRKMSALVNGTCNISQGYAMSKNAFDTGKKQYTVILVKNNEEVILRSVRKEGTKLGLHHQELYKLIRGEREQYNGWRVKAVSVHFVGSI